MKKEVIFSCYNF